MNASRTSVRRPFRAALSVVLLIGMVVGTARAQSSGQQVDRDYTNKILEFTTEKAFLTPYVDYLPASSTVPTPDEVLGHIVGAPDNISHVDEIYRYMDAVAAASPRVKVFRTGKSEEGRDFMLVVISDEATIADLDTYKGYMAALADPRKTDRAAADRIIPQAKAIYYATGGMHSTETGSPEMLMELVYRLAVDEGPFVKAIRDNMIVMVTPVLEVDGRDKEADVAMAPRINPDGNNPRRLLYWGAYVSHDNNRDGIGLSLQLSKMVMRNFFEYHPTVIHDLHESASHLYVSTGTGPYNAWLDPILVDEWYQLAFNEVTELTKLGVPGVWTYGFYDGWAPNYMFYAANGHNAIGRFYETQGAGDGSTRVISSNARREWYRPNPPLSQTLWSIRNNVNLQQSGLLVALNYVAQHKEKYLDQFYLKGVRSVAKATTEGPAAYVMPASDPRPGQQIKLIKLLQEQGVEIQQADKAFKLGDIEYGAGSYVIRMDQPYSRMADLLLDRQYYNVDDPRPYDDVGWTLGPLFNVQTDRILDTSILKVSMKMVPSNVMESGGVARATRGNAVYIINHNADNDLATFFFNSGGLKMEAAEAPFKVGDQSFNAGSFILKASDNPGDLQSRLEQAGRQYGFTAYSAGDVPEVAMHAMPVPRVALMHTWSGTQSEGWVRIALDKYKIPYDYISVHDIRDTPRLKDKWDVILFGPGGGNAMSVVNGLSGSEPQPYKKTEATPHLGRQASTDDMRGGIELEGVLHLRDFLQEGGVFVAIQSSVDLPIYFGLAPGASTRDTQELWARGGVFRAQVTSSSDPLTYGYSAGDLGVYFSSGPVMGGFGAAGRGRGGFGGGGASGRPSGRGSLDDPDVVQGRSTDLGEAAVQAYRESQASQRAGGAGGRGGFGGGGGMGTARPVVRFSSDVDDLLISGGLAGGEELAGSNAVTVSTVGEGNTVLFAINPMWRGETEGTYFLVFNALLNWESLEAGGR